MWAEVADEPLRALALYRDAVRILPDYVVATVHLAELEHELGQTDNAIERLASISAWAEDPEPLGLLAELLSDEDPDQADALTVEAVERYDRLLAAHRLAFADHGSEFFSGIGADPDRALALALSNLANRNGERALLVALSAAQGTDDEALACQLAASAEPDATNVHLRREATLQVVRCSL